MQRVTAPLLTLCASTHPTLADQYIVTSDGTGDFPTIQAAIDAANPGDVILLANGVFIGDGNRDLTFLGKAIALQSQSNGGRASSRRPLRIRFCQRPPIELPVL